jgi:hypothetical protein
MNDLMRLPLGILTGVGFIGNGARPGTLSARMDSLESPTLRTVERLSSAALRIRILHRKSAVE